MKCPIKKLESDCIEKECPLYFPDGCAQRSRVFNEAEAVAALERIEDKMGDLLKLLEEGSRRL